MKILPAGVSMTKAAHSALLRSNSPRADQCRIGTSVTAMPLPSSTRLCQSNASARISLSALRMVTSLPSGVITRGENLVASFDSVARSR